MGLGACVYCKCYREGRIFPLPFSTELIYINEEGELTLDLPYETHKDEHYRLAIWKEDACEHHNMSYKMVDISGWSGYRSFLEALANPSFISLGRRIIKVIPKIDHVS